MTAAERQPPAPNAAEAPKWMHGLLRRIAGASAHLSEFSATPLEGGVASDIWRIDGAAATFCVKRALPKLKVAADWQVPVERNASEVGWLQVAAGIARGSVPEVLAVDPGENAFAMTWLPPADYPVWKDQLRDGVMDPFTARRVGDLLGRLHAATADRAELAERFATDSLFHAIRLDPYLAATGRVHADLAGALANLAATTASTRRVLVHGDFSPKNLLIGPAGPVVIDAECAWYGDPAFDLAFVLNHLLLKGAWKPRHRSGYVDLYESLVEAYRPHTIWEPWIGLEARAARLLPALTLARIDGKSPVEYLRDEAAKARVRMFARELIVSPIDSLAAVAAQWRAAG